MTLKEKRIVILGGTSGIGLATAQAAAQDGAAIVVASSRQRSVDNALATLPAGTEGHALDLSNEEAVRGLFDRSAHSIIWPSPPAKRCNSANLRTPRSTRRGRRSICASGVRSRRPNMPAG